MKEALVVEEKIMELNLNNRFLQKTTEDRTVTLHKNSTLEAIYPTLFPQKFQKNQITNKIKINLNLNKNLIKFQEENL